MTQDEFIQIVRRYRDNTIMYERTKHYVYAHEIISLEKEIDAAIANYLADKKREQNIEIDFPSF